MGENNTKKVISLITLLFALFMTGVLCVKWFRFGTLDSFLIFAIFMAWSFFFNAITWGDHEGANAKDELDNHIKTQSAKISYFVLMIASGLILFISERTGDFNKIDNYPLVIVVGLTFLVLPMTEFIYSRKYRS
ncbi:hypothetical protein [Cytobacillus dafuensis]|uniref:DUF2178 domain-containing protein n=1 Tax=Cytobacillus dafuensis TaxID=1742359 RepID=A0A5B8Z0B0_CYTDA|nr:hypothetical protein [Cytobacillus dafuensis]QED46157.1 hypothetical protein FSZ17_01910 [Cytobacillus dafuensis]